MRHPAVPREQRIGDMHLTPGAAQMQHSWEWAPQAEAPEINGGRTIGSTIDRDCRPELMKRKKSRRHDVGETARQITVLVKGSASSAGARWSNAGRRRY